MCLLWNYSECTLIDNNEAVRNINDKTLKIH